MQSLSYRLRILFLIAAISSGIGCAYFNTFFWARQKFNEAEKSQRDDLRNQQSQQDNSQGSKGNQQPRPVGGAITQGRGNVVVSNVSSQQRILYEDAIKKAGKVLTLHPNSSWADDALWLIGKSYYNMGDFILADRKFKELVTNHPDSKFVDDSYFYMGLCQMSLGHNDQALSAFASIEKAPKKSPYLEDVIFAKAVMSMSNEDKADAIDLFTQYVEKYSNGDSAAQAMYDIGKCKEDGKDYFGAYQAYTKVRNYAPSKSLYFDASLAAASAALESDSITMGMKILETLGNDQKYFSRSGQIHLKSAEGYYLRGQVDKAIELYKDVVVKNPHSDQSA
jgi:TolA-binding protein